VNYNFRLRESLDPVQLVVLRGTSQVSLRIAPVEQKNDLDSIMSIADVEKTLVADLGILGVEIDPRVVDSTSGLRDPYGIIVAARAAGARSEVPLQPRDVIRSLNNTKMYTLDQLRGALRDLKPGTAVTLQVQREGRLIYVPFTLE
jgi:S1-C subfamily serine protease